MSFVLKGGLYSKPESGFCLENAAMFQIQDIFENGKPNIVLKTVKRFNIKRTLIIILIKKSLILGIVVLVMFNKMLVIVLLPTFTVDMGRDP